VAYLRTGPDAEEPTLESQRVALEAWALAHGVSVIAWCTELEIAPARAAAFPGDELLRALALVRTHRAGALLVSTRDRVSPDPLIVATVARMVAGFGAMLEAVAEGRQVEAEGDDANRIVSKVLDSYERTMQLVVRARKAIASFEARRGRAGVPPWGYRPAKDGKGWVPHEGEQRVLTVVRALRKQGATYATIATSLASDGFTTRTGRPFTTAGVHRMAKLDKAYLEAAYRAAKEAHARGKRVAHADEGKADDAP
jgi:hypothetical protein